MSHVPKVGADGLRRYNRWAGNPDGTPEDVTRCVEQVHEAGRGGLFYQCQRKRGHGPDGLFCKQHDPAAVKARDEAHRLRYELDSMKFKVDGARFAVAELARKVVRQEASFEDLEKSVNELEAVLVRREELKRKVNG